LSTGAALIATHQTAARRRTADRMLRIIQEFGYRFVANSHLLIDT